ncbi:SpoIIIAH-like family protein [Radiobacillus kanasensis]|uniref:SpoIIIAH-like family protein n=1 Tax=Radiobacillus kanasensis TaxID=2844358 RepID=UPI001E40DE52|nr:SpoIIIAH-like family protein [Radiobacillus kanasensis]UFT97735.1 SpoIIIAH-like family protein [Radiobacillus kanasensis]
MLKKQTIWLLTMLSLMIVLSVYYMSSPSGDQLALLTGNDNGETAIADPSSEDAAESEATGETAGTETTDAELFTTIRMELTDQRSAKIAQLEEVVASSSATTEEKNKALEEKEKLEAVQSKEKILEDTILAEKGYQDVLVRSNEGEVIVQVKAEEMSKTEANNIIKMVEDEFGRVPVEVKYHSVS